MVRWRAHLAGTFVLLFILEIYTTQTAQRQGVSAACVRYMSCEDYFAAIPGANFRVLAYDGKMRFRRRCSW